MTRVVPIHAADPLSSDKAQGTYLNVSAAKRAAAADLKRASARLDVIYSRPWTTEAAEAEVARLLAEVRAAEQRLRWR